MPAPYTGFSPDIKAEVERCRALRGVDRINEPKLGHRYTHIGWQRCAECGEFIVPVYDPPLLGRPRKYCDACRQPNMRYRAYLRRQPLYRLRAIAAAG